MPDGDVFTRSVARRWRGVASALRDRLSVEECARRIERGLAKELRETGGFERPDLQDLLRGGPANEALVEARLHDLVRNATFERVMPLLVAQEKFPNVKTAQRFMDLCLETARMDVLARSLLRHPTGRGVRRPPRARSTTSELLTEAAPSGGRT